MSRRSVPDSVFNEPIFNPKPSPRIHDQKLAAKWRDRISMPLEDIDPQNPWHLALLNDQGMSYKTIEKLYGVAHTTAHKLVKSVAPKEGFAHKFTLAQVICEEYLRDKDLPAKHKQEIAQWLNQNAERLLRIEGRYMTRKQENSALRREQSDKFTGEFWLPDETTEEPIELWA